VKRKILIFGGAGLVGSSLTRLLKKEDADFETISLTRKDADLFSLAETKDVISKFKPDYIINCAAKVGGILANNTYRTEFILENLKINVNVLESLINKPQISLINLGSSCIYPLNAQNPIKESYFMTGQLEPTNSPYAVAKITAIEIGRSITHEFGHKILNLMPTNLYGPNDYFSPIDSHVIPGLLTRMHDSKLNNQSIFEIWGTGKPLREFMFVDDLSSSIEFMLDKEWEYDLINIGTNQEISILELGNLIKKIVKYEGDLVFDSTKPDGNPRKLLDSTVITSLGWKPSVDLEEGLKITYDWYLENLEIKRS